MAEVVQAHERECAVCTNDFNTPKILPCGHLLCRECVISWMDSKSDAGCPLCTCPIVEHQGNSSQNSADVADTLPTDTVMEAIVESAHVLVKDGMCTVCDDVKAEYICMQCLEMMCQSCMKIHNKMAATRSHDVESLSTVTPERLAASRPALCADHGDKQAELFCVGHNLVICTSCFSNKHIACLDVRSMDEKLKSAENALGLLTENLVKAEDNLKQTIENLNVRINTADSTELKNMALVDKTCDRLQMMVDECRKQLKKLISDSITKFKNSLFDVKRELEKRLGKVTSHKHLVTRATTVRPRPALIPAAQTLTDRVHNLNLSDNGEAEHWVNPSPQIVKYCDDVVKVMKAELQSLEHKRREPENDAYRGSPQPPVLLFHENCGRNIRLTNGNTTARQVLRKFRGNGAVLSRDAMAANVLYECVDDTMVCNNQVDCDDNADEYLCHRRSDRTIYFEDLIATSARLDFREGRLTLTHYNMSEMSMFSCPVTDFMCASLQQVCLPVFLRCNGMFDCPDHEDEVECDRYSCPGFYRCRKSQVCVHESHMCDGVYHCPQRDDEILCNETCPQSCVCHGLAFICSDSIRAADYANLRYLDASRTLMTLADMRNNTFLVHLSLVHCNLTELHEVDLPNLRTLDLSYNKLTEISGRYFAGLQNIEFLKISNNPLTSFYLHNFTYTSPLKILDMSNVRILEIDFAIIGFFPTLTSLNLSGSQIKYVTGQGFPRIINFHVLDLRQCPITYFPKGIFQGLDRLETVFEENYKLCCPATLPKGFNVLNCHAPSDEVSSCDDLLRSNLYRVALATFASLSLLGNVGTLVYRLIFHTTAGNVGYDVFVSNLCVADLLMGVYLLIIGIADHKYRGFYVWEDVGWRNSGLCKVTGFVCLLSMEVSVLIIFLITVDRFLVLHFPFSSFHFRKRSAQLTCGLVWLSGLLLAVTPCLPMTSHWQFYNQSSICIPLPTSRVDFPGRKYSFIVIVVFNFICFLLIFVGQILIYSSIRSNSMSVSNTSKAINDIAVARRLITVVVSDFFCWFPVGLTGILASYDFPIAGEVNVAMAIFILPVNSALNPFLYTLNIYLERLRRAREEERQKRIMCQIKVAKIDCTKGG